MAYIQNIETSIYLTENHILVSTQEQESLQVPWRTLSHSECCHQFYTHIHHTTPSKSWELSLKLC